MTNKSPFPLKRHENNLIAVEQYIIGKHEISYNPDDNRFHVSLVDNICSVATFACNAKGWDNALYFVRRKEAEVLNMPNPRKCSKCEHYSYGLRRCRIGKINPPTIKGGLEAAKFMGISYICVWAKHYDAIRAKAQKGGLT